MTSTSERVDAVTLRAAVYESRPVPANDASLQVGNLPQTRYSSQVDQPFAHGENSHSQDRMTTENEKPANPVQLTDDDVAYLLSLLRDPAQTQPLTTQQLIDALRLRSAQ